MITCDLCGETKDCMQKLIENKEYDICGDCWRPLAERLKGKGRVKREREMVLLPFAGGTPDPAEAEPERREPKIWDNVNRMQ